MTTKILITALGFILMLGATLVPTLISQLQGGIDKEDIKVLLIAFLFIIVFSIGAGIVMQTRTFEVVLKRF